MKPCMKSCLLRRAGLSLALMAGSLVYIYRQELPLAKLGLFVAAVAAALYCAPRAGVERG
jgi:hypothetical protein